MGVAPLHPFTPTDESRERGAMMSRIYRDGFVEVLRGSLAHRTLEELRRSGEVKVVRTGAVYCEYEGA